MAGAKAGDEDRLKAGMQLWLVVKKSLWREWGRGCS